MLAWHFVSDTLRDGRPLPADGEVLRHEGRIIPCESGLHGSERLIDALTYAPGTTLCRVRLGGEIVPHDDDKFAASKRVILWRFDATELLRAFARRCALDVIHLWNAPVVVREYLETGREDIRAASEVASWAAAWAASEEGARTASWAASEAASSEAGARTAAWAGAMAGARAAAWKGAMAGAWAGSEKGAMAGAWAGAMAGARATQNENLTTLIASEAARLGYEMEPALNEEK